MLPALRSYRRAAEDRDRGVCANALHALDAAKQQHAMAIRATNGVPVEMAALVQHLKDGRTPSCPTGGDYTIGPVGQPPACTVHGSMDRLYPPASQPCTVLTR